MAKSLESQ